MFRQSAADLALPAIAVTDATGHLRAFEAMNDAPFLAHDVAIDKAWTAAAYRLPTHTWYDVIRDPVVAPLAHIPGWCVPVSAVRAVSAPRHRADFAASSIVPARPTASAVRACPGR